MSAVHKQEEKMSAVRAMGRAISEDNCQVIEIDNRTDAKRVINRFATKGWWFGMCHTEGYYYIAFASHIDLQKDLKFEPEVRFVMA